MYGKYLKITYNHSPCFSIASESNDLQHTKKDYHTLLCFTDLDIFHTDLEVGRHWPPDCSSCWPLIGCLTRSPCLRNLPVSGLFPESRIGTICWELRSMSSHPSDDKTSYSPCTVKAYIKFYKNWYSTHNVKHICYTCSMGKTGDIQTGLGFSWIVLVWMIGHGVH